MSKRPFKQTKEDNIIIRKFSNKVKGHELKWHYDLKHRIVICEHETNWVFQMDNELPKKIEKNSIIEIPPYVYHRVIKGDGDLIVSIKES
jgi:hypothetical protein